MAGQKSLAWDGFDAEAYWADKELKKYVVHLVGRGRDWKKDTDQYLSEPVTRRGQLLALFATAF